MLKAISPIDGRYASKTRALVDYFSEYALIRYRVLVEITYFHALCSIPLPALADFPEEKTSELIRLLNNFSEKDAERIKAIEKTTNHDVKAVEYFLKEAFQKLGLEAYQEYIHFGLTSQDINNTAIPLLLKDALHSVYLPAAYRTAARLLRLADEWLHVPMLARTHGQPASPTLLGKELWVFIVRLQEQLGQLRAIEHRAKFGGATGNLNAHYVTFPNIEWQDFADDFVGKHLGLVRSYPTTQIEHYDNLAAIFHALVRINTVLIDLCRDMWTYISMDYFKQKAIKGEIGSSAMPHKVNPIDFENAEGNLGLASALLEHLAAKLPVSRLQRDLTDSTVLRNIGVPFGHMLIALQSIEKGLDKLLLNEAKLREDLQGNWVVVAEALQSILRREAYPKPYETLLELTRGKASVTRDDIHRFIDGLDVRQEVKEEMKKISPENYTGVFRKKPLDP
ncbi:MAG: adenylosuccinate lyase [Saprospiraceae bacterium]|nr:adenylosuccinate lyase [Saprospiraceae bacterium]